jgi:hypothetical protein
MIQFKYLPPNSQQAIQDQNEDHKTKKQRDMKIELTDVQDSNLTVLAYRCGFKNSDELIESLIGDLTHWHSNGSDEKLIAREWLNRAFGSSLNTMYYFREYLLEFEVSIGDLLNDKDKFDNVYKEYKNTYKGRTHNSKKECSEVVKEYKEMNE